MSVTRKITLVVCSPSLWPPLALTSFLLLTAAILIFAPFSETVSLYYGRPLKGITVAIDPGHGGIDSGTHFESVMLEKEIVLEIGLELRRLLEQAGARVMITREKDEDLSRHCPDGNLALHRRDVRGRVELINASAADFLISLHLNSIYDSSVRGPIAFYAGGNPDNKRLAETIQEYINPLFRADAKPGQLVHQQPQESSVYYILNEAAMPSVLLEMAFMSSPADRELLQSESFRRKISREIFMGMVAYIYEGLDNAAPAPDAGDWSPATTAHCFCSRYVQRGKPEAFHSSAAATPI